MLNVTLSDIQSWNPPVDPLLYLASDWVGTALDLLNDADIPYDFKLWCVMRPEFLSDNVRAQFASHSFGDAVSLLDAPDQKRALAVQAHALFDLGQASAEDVAAADAAVETAVESVGWVAETSAWSPTEAATWATAWVADRAVERAAEAAPEWVAEADELEASRDARISLLIGLIANENP